MENAIIFKSVEEVIDCANCPFKHFQSNIEFMDIDVKKMSYTSEIKREVSECWGGETVTEIEYPIKFGSANCPIQVLKQQDDLSYAKDYKR